MKRRFILLLMICAIASVSVVAQSNDADKINALQIEVRTLRLELIQQRIEFQRWKIEQLETALKEAKETREKLEAEERTTHQALTETEGDEAANYRTELSEYTLKKLQSQQTAAQLRESELQQILTREQTVLQDLMKRRQQLKIKE